MQADKRTIIVYLFMFGGIAIALLSFKLHLSDSITSALTSIGLISVFIGVGIKFFDIFENIKSKNKVSD